MSQSVRSAQAGLKLISITHGLRSSSRTISNPNTSKQLFFCSCVSYRAFKLRQTTSDILGSISSFHVHSGWWNWARAKVWNQSIDITSSYTASDFFYRLKLLKCLNVSYSWLRSNSCPQSLRYAAEKMLTSRGSQLFTNTHYLKSNFFPLTSKGLSIYFYTTFYYVFLPPWIIWFLSRVQ